MTRPIPSKQRFCIARLLPLMFAAFATSLFAQDLETMRVEKIYQSLCASCHGADFEGGLGGNLADGEWVHGGSDAAILRNIKEGIPSKDMVGFGTALTEEQLRAMVVYLREQENKADFQKREIPTPDPNTVVQSQRQSYRIEILTEGLTLPWGLAFLPDGRKLVTERDGQLRLIDRENQLDPRPIKGIPAVIFDGPEGGLMDIASHPDFQSNGWIYLAFADGWRQEGEEDAWAMTAVVRGRIQNHQWVDQEWIYRADQRFYRQSGAHFGSRLAFDGDYLYLSIGERGSLGDAQDLSLPNGKVHRLHDDGRVPQDNPFRTQPDALPGIWSYGHRNQQGLYVDPSSHRVYATEHGARGGDEFNLIQAGKNYGWPVITHGMNYNGKPITSITEKEGMEQPILHWTPSIATCGLTRYQGEAFPDWNGDFFVGGLRSEELRRIRLEGTQETEQELIFKGLGRVRDVRAGPDGFLYVLTNKPGRLLRLVPGD